MGVGALTSGLQSMPIAVKTGTTALATTTGRNLPAIKQTGALAVIADAAQVVKKSGTKWNIITAFAAGVWGFAMAANLISDKKAAKN